MEPSRLLRVDTEQSLRDFEVTGLLGDEVVRALYEDGRLFVDGRLLTHATLLVELGEVLRVGDHGLSVQATLDGSAYAVFMTLLVACDRVISTAFDLGPDILS